MKLSKVKLLLASLLIVVGVFLIGVKLFADGGSNMYGYLWSSNIGWIQMNDCSNPADSTTCVPSGSFGVSILPVAPGTMSGYAWSSNIGWITFNSVGCPTTGCTPGASATWAADGTATIKGWARACSVYASGCSGSLKDNAYLGTWDGYIALDSTTAGGSNGAWGLKINADKTMSGYAWGSQVIGWVKSINAAIYIGGPTVTLTPNPASISSGDSSTLTATAANIDGANACSIAGVAGLVMTQGTGGAWTGSVKVSPLTTTTYTVTCTKGSQNAKAQATVIVTYLTTPTNPGNGGNGGNGGSGGTSGGSGANGGYCTNQAPQFAWNLDGTQCSIKRSPDGATQSVPCNSADTASAFGVTPLLGTDGRSYYTDTVLPVVGLSSTYKISSDTNPTGYTVTVASCGQDFILKASPSSQVFTLSKDGKTISATYTVSVIPVSGFTLPIDLTIASYPQTGANAMPKSTAFAFSNPELTYSGSAFNTSQLTITIDAADISSTVNYSPIVIQGIGGSYTRQTQVSANAKVATPPIFKEF